ncbi:TetR/AcrR family transcriptional regulator [Nocardia sp. 2]|uniref:TetR/AcrR family transcriptional regulator n=1 Tax=Nocardia acididurans TaxID=2802282 RepID=A0ABS1M4H4_9NOCA|nr:TetR/AcrR family transcriptional regulator [Nocardia acididurans]MBL1075434.1 TetR/AcrR family transcriptional regulator [Nocardia acididurans]
MPRPREFDEDRALDAAMRQFWATGYEATSTEQLCTATGLRRSSIYNTFQSKHALFLQALTRYTRWRTGMYLELLQADSPAPQRLRAVLEHAVDMAVEAGRDGCLAVNTVTECSARDSEVDELLRADNELRATAIRDVVAAGQRAGELSRDRAPGDVAEFINATLAGISVTARCGGDRRTLRAIAEVAMAAL